MQLGRYILVELLGRGGMATVYRAQHVTSRRQVAVKVLTAAMAETPQFSARFRREARLIHQLNHPNIVPLIDFGQQDGYVFLVMPWMRAGSLKELVERRELSLREIARLMQQICGALAYAHSKGVVHRDLKPSNILLDTRGHAYLTDFGLAQVQDASVSLTGSMVVGTPAYISPEQAKGDPIDHRSDQYSLGIMLFRLLTGELPFHADTPVGLLIQHISEPLPSPRSFNDRIPQGLEMAILKATAKRPVERFRDILTFNRALQESIWSRLRGDPLPAAWFSQFEAKDTIPESQAEQATSLPGSRQRGRLPWVLAALMLLSIPAVGLPLAARLRAPPPPTATPTPTPAVPLTAMAATIDALSTELAQQQVTVQPGLLSTAVAGTLQATASGTPAVGDLTPTPTPTETGTSGTELHAPGNGALSTPSPTPTLTPTDTPGEPLAGTPTPTPTPEPDFPILDSCAGIIIGDSWAKLKEFNFEVRNDRDEDVRIEAIKLDWPASNEILEDIYNDERRIWDADDHEPPTTVVGDWDGKPADRVISAGKTARLNFEFDESAAATGYQLWITFDIECTASGSG